MSSRGSVQRDHIAYQTLDSHSAMFLLSPPVRNSIASMQVSYPPMMTLLLYLLADRKDRKIDAGGCQIGVTCYTEQHQVLGSSCLFDSTPHSSWYPLLDSYHRLLSCSLVGDFSIHLLCHFICFNEQQQTLLHCSALVSDCH